MSFRYEQSTGKLFHDDELIASGYSGNTTGLNNPLAQNQHSVGPIPQGRYTISAPHADEQVGPIAMRLTPDPTNEMYGRGDFLIHGDNTKLDHSASHGCIIMPHGARIEVGNYVLRGDNVLEVVA